MGSIVSGGSRSPLALARALPEDDGLNSLLEVPDDIADALRSAGARVRVGFPRWLRPFLVRGVIGITLGRTIYLLPDFVSNPRADVLRLLRHELAHVRQVNRLTLPLFLVRYLGEFAFHLVRERSVGGAYRRISFEIEACKAEDADDAGHAAGVAGGL